MSVIQMATLTWVSIYLLAALWRYRAEKRAGPRSFKVPYWFFALFWPLAFAIAIVSKPIK
jgi:hypothetical protein